MTTWTLFLFALLGSGSAYANVTANAGGPYTVDAEGSVTLDGSRSGGCGCADGGTMTYCWDVTGDAVCDNSWNSADTYDFSAAGIDGPVSPTVTFYARCQSICEGTYVRSATTTVTVNNVPPVISSVGGPLTRNEGQVGGYEVFFTDVEAADTHTYSVDFGDGNVKTDNPTWNIWADDGVYTVNVLVTDDDSGSDTDSLSVTVNNVAPSIDASTIPTTANEGDILGFSVTASDVAADTISYLWELDTAGTGDTDTNPSLTYTYIDQGTYDGVLTVSDEDGGVTTQPFQVVVSNVAPTLDSTTVPLVGDEGESLGFSAQASDPGDDTLTYTWDFGTGSDTAVGASATFSWPEPGSYTVVLTVDDGDGGEATDQWTVVISNLPPTINSLTVPSVADEGDLLDFSVSSSDPGGGNTTRSWDFGDGTSVVLGPTAQHTYADDGDFDVVITITDGATATASDLRTVAVANVAPTATLTGDVDDSGGATLSWSVAIADPGTADTHTIDWDFGDSTSQLDGNAAESHTYTQNGTFDVVVTVTDDDGGVDTDTLQVVIGSVGPSVTDLTGDLTGVEGQELSWTCTGADNVGTGTLVYSWDFGDGNIDGDVTTASHTFRDNGTYTVRCVVRDGAGTTGSGTVSVVVDNVAPTVTGTPGLQVNIQQPYTFTPGVTDPGLDDTHTWSGTVPAGANLAANGEVTWTPMLANVGPHTITVTVTDNDGDSDSLVYTLDVVDQDTDGDGMSDVWEDANGLDKLDPDDRDADPDGDGRANIDEYWGGTDPQTNEAPSGVTLVTPADNDELTDSTPDLVVTNGASPIGATLTYQYDVYIDEALTTLLTSTSGVAEDVSGETAWTVDVALQEDTWYWWTATLTDGYFTPPAPAANGFFVSTQNDAPSAPNIAAPVNNSSVATFNPALVLDEAYDREGDAMTYTIVILDGTATTELDREANIAPVTGQASWTVPWALSDQTAYCFYGFATDEHGAVGPDSLTACFLVDQFNNAPTEPTILFPQTGTTVAVLRPQILTQDGVDPEGGQVYTDWQIDIDPAYNTSAFQQGTVAANGSGQTTWQPASLIEDATHYLRVRASDGDADSNWVESVFVVDTFNAAPTVPGHVAPPSGSPFVTGDTLTIANSTDPEGDPITYEFVLFDRQDNEAWSTTGVAQGAAGETTVMPDELPFGIYTWQVRAVDLAMHASEWSLPWTIEVVEDVSEDTGTSRTPDGKDPVGGDETNSGPAGCSCNNGGAAGGLGLAVLAGALVRRRKDW